MANQPVVNDQFLNIDWPMHGLDVTDEFAVQAPGTTTDCVNVRTFEAMTQRGRGGVRPGISRYIDQRVGGLVSPIQHLNYIVDPQAEALVAPDETIGLDFIPDPSTNNLRTRNPGLGEGPGIERSVRRKGNARQTNRKRPSVGKVTPDINWSNPADILAGTPLSGTQLNAIATDPSSHLAVAGVFTYTPPSGTVLGIGAAQNLHVNFAPTDTATYNSASGDVSINVNGLFRQVHSASFSGAGPTITFASNLTAGNVVLVVVGCEDSSAGTTVTVTDSQGNAYSQVGGYARAVENAGGAEVSMSFWSATAGSSGPDTVTVTYSSGGASGYKVGYELAAVTVDSAMTAFGNYSSPGSNFNIGSLTVTGLDIVIAYYNSYGPLGTLTGYAIDANVPPTGGGAFHKSGVTSAETVSPSGTPSAGWVGIAVSLKP